MRLHSVVVQEQKENQEKQQREEQEKKAEMERLKREAEERAESKRKKEIAELKRIEREQRIESLKKTAVGIRALETITASVEFGLLHECEYLVTPPSLFPPPPLTGTGHDGRGCDCGEAAQTDGEGYERERDQAQDAGEEGLKN